MQEAVCSFCTIDGFSVQDVQIAKLSTDDALRTSYPELYERLRDSDEGLEEGEEGEEDEEGDCTHGLTFSFHTGMRLFKLGSETGYAIDCLRRGVEGGFMPNETYFIMPQRRLSSIRGFANPPLVAISGDGSVVAYVSAKSINIYYVATGRPVCDEIVMEGFGMAVQLSHSGDLLIVHEDSWPVVHESRSCARVWQTDGAVLLHTIQKREPRVCISGDGSAFAVTETRLAPLSSVTRVYSTRQGTLLREEEHPDGLVTSVTLSHSGEVLAEVVHERVEYMHRQQAKVCLSQRDAKPVELHARTDDVSIDMACLSADGRTLALIETKRGGGQGRPLPLSAVVVYADACEQSAVPHRAFEHESEVHFIALAGDGSKLISIDDTQERGTSGNMSNVRVRDARDGSTLHSAAECSPITSASFADECMRMAVSLGETADGGGSPAGMWKDCRILIDDCAQY